MHTASSRSADAAGLVVAASVVAIDPNGWYPFVVLKWSAVAIAVVMALWAHLQNPFASRIPARISRSYGALLVVLAIAAVFGRDPIYAWTGTPERHLGILTWCAFAASLVTGGSLNSPLTRTRFARWVSGATVFAGVYASSELAGRSPLRLQTATDRVGGPYGSASLFGAALCLLVPISFSAALNGDESRTWRTVAWIAGFLGTVAVVATGTRAAWVGMSAALLIAASAVVVRRWSAGRRVDGSRRVRERWWMVLTAMTAISAIAVGGIATSINDADVTGRALGGSSRVAEWEVGLRIVGAHPVLGVGPEGYRTALADGVTANYERTYGRGVLPDRAHNVLIDVAAAGGVLAAALYAAIAGLAVAAAWLVVGRSLGRHVSRRPTDAQLPDAIGVGAQSQIGQAAVKANGHVAPNRAGPDVDSIVVTAPVDSEAAPHSPRSDPVLVGFAVSATAYLVQQWFLFPVATIDPILWMLAGSLFVTVWGGSSTSNEPPPSSGWRRPGPWTGAMFALVIIGLGVNAVFALAADRAARSGVERGDLRSAQHAARLRPDVVRYRLLESQLEPSSVAGRRAAIDDLAGALRVSPHDPIIDQAHAGAMLRLAIATGDQHDIDAARTAIRRLAEEDPNCYRCALMLGYSEALANEPAAARTAFGRAAELARAGDTEAQDNLDQLERMKLAAPTEP